VRQFVLGVTALGVNLDPFAILGLSPSFDSRAFHPDRYVGAGASERREALARAIEVNEAWRVVRDPIRRAEALLDLRGAGVSEDREPKPEPEFLMEMLEQREALSEAMEARDHVAIRKLADAIRARSDETERALARGFVKGDSVELLGTLGQLRFYRRFLDEVSAVEDEF
jgi:molecular chaperone HscB